VTLKRSFVAYLLVFHLLFVLLGAFLLFRNRAWLFALELAFVLSIVWGLALARRFFGALSTGEASAQLLAEADFQSRLRETGREETDQLIRVYNRMAEHLRDERVRLQEQQHLLSKILDVSPSGIVIFDFDGRITFVNAGAGRLFGRDPATMLRRTLSELGSPLAASMAQLGAGESRVVPLWGGRRVKCHRGSFIDRGFERTFVFLEELTEELRQHEKAAYEKVIRIMSHEVNNSMGAAHSLLKSCLNYAPQLRDADRGDFETALRVVSQRTQELSNFMRSFAEVVRLPLPRFQPCDLRGLLEAIAVLLGPASAERHIAWRWDVRDDLPPVAADRAQMEQVFMNICKNALEAIGRDGTITLRLSMRANRPSVTVEDTGAGIPADTREHLFTPFFSTKDKGQGIGLTVVQDILSQHRFEYSLDSQPGGPTRFTIVF
jgi:two-component system nitrogen regulation sensor histidine kinase NtrY